MKPDKKYLIKKLMNHKMTLEEISEELHKKPEIVKELLMELNRDNIPVDVSTAHQGKQLLYHINVLPQTGNVFRISDKEKGIINMNYGASSDWHFGSIFHLPNTWHECMKRLEDKDIRKVYVAGDIVDGNGKIYHGQLENLSDIGIENQTDRVAEALIKHPHLEFWGIAGNHCYSFTKDNGAKPLAILEQKVDNFKNLGDLRADIIYKGIRIRLLHGGSGRAYALSYPSQTYLRDWFKGLERDEIAQMPHVMLIGHYHTVYSAKDHGIHIIQPGSFQDSDNEYCIRRGLTGPAGLFAINMIVNNGVIEEFQQEYIQPNMKERGNAFAKTTKSYK